VDTERRRRVEEIVSSALELPIPSRREYVAKACGGDEELQREVEELLRLDGTVCDRFGTRPPDGGQTRPEPPAVQDPGTPDNNMPPRPVSPPRPSASGLPKVVGPFQVLELLGEGGMGAVYLAEQKEPVHRRLAVKVIRAELTSPRAEARFDAERQALALLSHPNIARLYQAGTTAEGFPYFAMEYCSGMEVSEYCDQHRLSIEERLNLFITICEAVQHAHRRGIIHRDLKPSNILITEVDGRPEAKIIDFGIAKAVDEPLNKALELTRDCIVGTPSFMSPEALRLVPGIDDIDTRTDVYSLGVVMYELLTGMRPFAVSGGDLVQFLAQMANEEAPRPGERLAASGEATATRVAEARRSEPRALARRLAGDLDWIACKAIARDRDLRYGSPAELAADVRRYLDHKPVEASPPSVRYRVGKFVRRHRSLVAVAVVAVLALVGGTIATTIAMLRANQEAARANNEAATATDVSRFLMELFSVSDPSEARGNDITAREILDRGAEKIERELAGQPLVQARLMDTMGQVYGELGLYEPAKRLLERALELRRAELGERHVDVATSLHDLANVLYAEGDYTGAERLLREALATRRLLLGEADPAVAASLNDLGMTLWQKDERDAAEQMIRQALALNRRFHGTKHPDALAVSLTNLGWLLRTKGDYDAAEPLYREALATYRKLYGEEHPRVATLLNNLAIVVKAKGDTREAESLHREALAMRRRLFGNDHPDVAVSLNNLAVLLSQKGDLEGAEPFFREALEIRRRKFAEGDPRVMSSLFSGRLWRYNSGSMETSIRRSPSASNTLRYWM
jgi:serine/threonine protein kinase/Flp pilus assembly protein TadD